MVRRPREPDTGDLVATLAVTRRFDLTDAQWAILEPLLPAPRRPCEDGQKPLSLVLSAGQAGDAPTV
jgi:hypothetical protein